MSIKLEVTSNYQIREVIPVDQQKLILIRGEPNTGKTTLARIISDNNPAYVMVEANQFFDMFDRETGQPRRRFSTSMLPAVNNECLSEVLQHLDKGKSVVVPNSFIHMDSVKIYLEMVLSNTKYKNVQIMIVTMDPINQDLLPHNGSFVSDNFRVLASKQFARLRRLSDALNYKRHRKMPNDEHFKASDTAGKSEPLENKSEPPHASLPIREALEEYARTSTVDEVANDDTSVG